MANKSDWQKNEKFRPISVSPSVQPSQLAICKVNVNVAKTFYFERTYQTHHVASNYIWGTPKTSRHWFVM